MKIRPFVYALLFLLLVGILSIVVGSVPIPLADIWRVVTGQPPQSVTQAAVIILSLRLPRTALVMLTGAALGCSGAAYQGLFRNPLADPYLIGVASGAGLGAVIAMAIRWPYNFLGLLAIPLAAFTTALLTVAIVYMLARVGRTVPTTNLIL